MLFSILIILYYNFFLFFFYIDYYIETNVALFLLPGPRYPFLKEEKFSDLIKKKMLCMNLTLHPYAEQQLFIFGLNDVLNDLLKCFK